MFFRASLYCSNALRDLFFFVYSCAWTDSDLLHQTSLFVAIAFITSALRCNWNVFVLNIVLSLPWPFWEPFCNKCIFKDCLSGIRGIRRLFSLRLAKHCLQGLFIFDQSMMYCDDVAMRPDAILTVEWYFPWIKPGFHASTIRIKLTRMPPSNSNPPHIIQHCLAKKNTVQ